MCCSPERAHSSYQACSLPRTSSLFFRLICQISLPLSFQGEFLYPVSHGRAIPQAIRLMAIPPSDKYDKTQTSPNGGVFCLPLATAGRYRLRKTLIFLNPRQTAGFLFYRLFIVGAIPCRNGKPSVCYADISLNKGVPRIARMAKPSKSSTSQFHNCSMHQKICSPLRSKGTIHELSLQNLSVGAIQLI